MAKYEVTEKTIFFEEGDIVYDMVGWDYGLANDDTRYTGIEHTSVATQEDGEGKFYTIPKRALRRIND